MKKENKEHIIFTNDVIAMADSLYEDVPEEERGACMFDTAYEEIERWLDDEMINLDIPCGKILCVADLVRWNGTFSAYRELGENVNSIFDILGDGTYTFYEKDGELMAESTGHDNPVSPSVYRFRELKPDTGFPEYDDLLAAIWDNSENKEELVRKYTEPMGYYPAKMYGW